MKPLYAQVACAVGAALLATSCTETKERAPTAVVVAIEAESMVRASIDSVHVEVASGPSRDELETRAQERFSLAEGGRWPLTLTLLPKTAGTSMFRIWVRAQRDGNDVAELRVISGFAPERVLLLEVVLPDACIGFLSCDTDQTCAAGDDGDALCVLADVPVVELAPFTEDAIDRLRDAGAGADSGVEDSGEPIADGGEPPPDGGEPPPDGGEPAPERCDNGRDDDGDGAADCADDDCDAGYVCAPDGDDLAILLSNVGEGCPGNYDEATEVSNDLMYGDRCAGCGCSVSQAADCRVPIFFYASADECNAGGTGTLVHTATTSCPSPVGEDDGVASPFGWRVGDITPTTPATCNASGIPRIDEPEWRRTRKLCRPAEAIERGGGCDEGYACIPRVETESGAYCALVPAGDACPAGNGQDWYTGYRDDRSCMACSCNVQGGSCDGATARLGSDYACGVDYVGHEAAEGERICLGNSVYYPPVDLVGSPTAATCTGTAATIGTIALLGGQRVCCNP